MIDYGQELFSLLMPHWNYCEEGEFSAIGRDYLYRVPEVPAAPKKGIVKYEDENIVIVALVGKLDKHYGFGIRILREGGFAIVDQQHAILVADATSRKHLSTEYVINTPSVRAVRATTDGSIGVSYWVSVKRKETCL